MRIDFNAQVSVNAVSQLIGTFFPWWRSQLLGLLPERLRARFASASERIVLVQQGNMLRSKSSPKSSSGKAFAISDLAAAREQISRDAPTWLRGRVDIALAPDEVLERRITLPAAAAARLGDAIKLQLDRLSPFHGEDVRFTYNVISRDQNEVALEVAMVPKSVLMKHEAKLHALGLAVRRFRSADDKFYLYPAKRYRTRQETLRWALGGTACAVWLAALLLAPGMRAAELDALSNKVISLRPSAERGADLRDKVEHARASSTLAANMLTGKAPLVVLDTLTELVPNDAQVLLLTLDDNRLELEGVAVNAMWTINRLGRSHQFKMVRLVSPVPEGAHTLEHFRIEAEFAAAERQQGDTP